MCDFTIVNYIPETNFVGNLSHMYMMVEDIEHKRYLIKKDVNFLAYKNGKKFYTFLIRNNIYDKIENKLEFIKNILNDKTNDYIAMMKIENFIIDYNYNDEKNMTQQFKYKNILDINLHFINSEILF
jgi:hypothetical protein